MKPKITEIIMTFPSPEKADEICRFINRHEPRVGLAKHEADRVYLEIDPKTPFYAIHHLLGLIGI